MLVYTATKRSPEDQKYAYMQTSLPDPTDDVVDGNDAYGSLDGNGPDEIVYDGFPDGILDGNTLLKILDGNYLEGIIDGNDST